MDRNFRSCGGSRKPGGFKRYITPKVPAESSKSVLSHTCNYNDTTNYNPRFLAVHNGEVEVTHSLLDESSLEEEVSGKKLIHIAAARGHEQVIRLLCKRNAQINEGDKDGNTPLHLAIKGNHTDVVNLLLNEVTVNLKNLREATPLHIATEMDNLLFVDLLLRSGAEVDEQDEDGKTPLHISAGKPYPIMEIIMILLTHGASVHTSCEKGFTPLHFAAQTGNEEIVKLLVTEGDADKINARSKDMYMPLHFSAANGHIKVSKYLIECGAKIDPQTAEGDTPLHLAAAAGNVEIVNELLNHGAEIDPFSTEGFTPLTVATKARRTDVVRLLLNKGASATHCRIPAFHVAAKIGDEEIVMIFLTSGIDVDLKSKNDKTALHFAATCGHRKVVEELIKAGANINSLTKFFETPLHLASASGRSSIVKYLLDSGAAIHATCRNYTPLHYALDRERHDALINHKKAWINFPRKIGIYYVEAGLKPRWDRSPNEVLVTPFWFEKYLQITEMLLVKGASVTSQTLEGDCPLDYAIKIRVSKDDESKHSSNSLGEVNASKRRKENEEFRPEIVRCLLNYVAETNFCKASLTSAIELNWSPLVDVLLEYDINDSFDYPNALNLAQEKGDFSIILAIAEKISDIETIVDLLCSLNIFSFKIDLPFALRPSTPAMKLQQKENIKLLVAIIVKMRSTSKIANVVQARELKFLEGENLTEWYTQCELEVMNMRERKIHHQSDITFYEILMSPVSKMAYYARNENLMQILDSGTCKQFAAFAPCLERSIAKGKERKDLIEYSTECFFTLVRQHCKTQMPSLIVDKVFEYLSVTDLRKLSSTIHKKCYHYD